MRWIKASWTKFIQETSSTFKPKNPLPRCVRLPTPLREHYRPDVNLSGSDLQGEVEVFNSINFWSSGLCWRPYKRPATAYGIVSAGDGTFRLLLLKRSLTQIKKKLYFLLSSQLQYFNQRLSCQQQHHGGVIMKELSSKAMQVISTVSIEVHQSNSLENHTSAEFSCRVQLATAEVRCFVYRFGDPYESRRRNKILLREFIAALERSAQVWKTRHKTLETYNHSRPRLKTWHSRSHHFPYTKYLIFTRANSFRKWENTS